MKPKSKIRFLKKKSNLGPKIQKSMLKVKNLMPKTEKSTPKNPKTPKTKNQFPKDQNSNFGDFTE